MRPALALAVALLACACVRSPQPRLYTLVTRAAGAGSDSPVIVQVRRPNIAGYLDRREIVQRVLAGRLEIASDALWAEPLDAMLGRVLAADLALRLPRGQVFSEASGLSAAADVRVDVDLERLEQDAQGRVVLDALLALHGRGQPQAALERVQLARTTAGTGTAQLVEAIDELLGQLADRIAGTLAALPPLVAQGSAEPTAAPAP